MDKHITLLKQLMPYWWDKRISTTRKWVHIPLSTQDYYIKCYIYDNLKNNE
mgnify:CR=1 FL=1